MKQFITGFLLVIFSFHGEAQIDLPSPRVGINTTHPQAALHVRSADQVVPMVDPLIVEAAGEIKLRTSQNGGTSIGSGVIPPENGLYVKGTLRPDNGISTPQKLTIESAGESITLKAGTSTIVMDKEGNITITAGNSNTKIEINSAGHLNLSARNLKLSGDTVEINAHNSLKLISGVAMDLKSTTTMKIQTSALMEINAAIIALNGGGRPVAAQESTTVVTGGPQVGVGTIVGNTSTTVLVP